MIVVPDVRGMAPDASPAPCSGAGGTQQTPYGFNPTAKVAPIPNLKVKHPYSINALPAPPDPKYDVQNREEMIGCLVVISISCGMVAAGNGFTFQVVRDLFDGHASVGKAFPHLVLILCGLLSWICLAGMLLGDPGVVQRGEETCYPIPPAILTKLKTGQAVIAKGKSMAHANVLSDDRLSSYCVRCFVWRPLGTHHCSICGVCVRDFDHHCNFYGRCVAGPPHCGGNWCWFNGMILITFVAGLSFVVCLISLARDAG